MSRNPSPARAEPSPGPTFIATRWRWPGMAVAALSLAWAVICLAAYYRQQTIPFFSVDLWLNIWAPLGDAVGKTWVRHFPPAAWFVGFVVGAMVVGRAALDHFTQLYPLNILERWAFSYGLGAGIWGLLMFALSLAGLLRPAAMHLALAALVGVCWWRGRESVAVEDLETKRLWAGVAFPLGVFTVAALLLVGVYALSPEIGYDSLVYHLALPALYTMEGAMVPTPTMVYSGIPLHMEMLYLWALNGGGPITAKLIHWSMGVGVSLVMLGFFVRRGTPWAGWATCAIFFSMPMTGFNFSRAFIEAGSVFFVLLAASVLMLLIDQPDPAIRPRRFLVLAAFFVGIAMSMKYPNGPVFIVFLGALVLSRHISRRNTALFGLVAVACVAPWLVKNAVFYKNPVFPFFHEWWVPDSATPVNWRGLQADALGRAWGPPLANGGRPLWEALVQPLLMTFKVKYSGDALGVLPLVFLPAVWFLKPVTGGAVLLIRIFTGVLLAWFLTTSMPRMLLPGLALLAMIEGVALAQVPNRWLRWAVGAVVLLVSVNNMALLTAALAPVDMKPYLTGATDTAGYLKATHSTYPSPDYASREWINRQTPPSARVLVLGDARGFYLERPFQTASVFDTDPFWRMVDESASAEDLYRRLTDKGFSHLLVNVGEIIRLKRGCPSKKAGSLERAEAFFKQYTRTVFGEKNTAPKDYRWSLVYAIVPFTGDAPNIALLVDLYRALAEKEPS